MKAQHLPFSSRCLASILVFLFSVVANNGFIAYWQWHIPSFHSPSRAARLPLFPCRHVTTSCHATSAVSDDGPLHSHNKSELGAISTAISTNSTETNPDPPLLLSQLHTYQKPRQRRTSTGRRPRKPRFYWQSHNNLRNELNQFWDELSVTIPRDQPPPIPSEYLLNYFHRNDLRWGISQMGGRENVAYILGGAKVIPGKWEQAIEFDEVKQLLPRMGDGQEGLPKNELRRNKQKNSKQEHTQEDPTMQQSHEHGNQDRDVANSTQISLTTNNSATSLMKLSSLSFDKRINSTTGQTKEFWSKEKTVKNIFQYLDSYRKFKQRPAVWMPQLAELSQEGYSKLFNACSRFKKLPCTHPVFSSTAFSSDKNDRTNIHHVAGLVPFREWRYFESQLQLYVELEYYLSLYHNSSEEYFPEPTDVQTRGHQQLYDLIRIHGGKTMLAQKLDMKYAWEVGSGAIESTSRSNQRLMVAKHGALLPRSDRSWGPFSLGFAVKLLHFIRSQYLLLNPPLSCAHISMPSESDLIRGGYEELATQVTWYGGYENVARKLGLQFFDEKSQWMDERAFRVAKLLWKNRHNENIIVFDGPAKNSTVGKTKGVPWNEELVVRELLAYTQVNMTKRSLPHFVMPRFQHLDEDGRDDLRRAISKFGGSKYISEKAQLTSIEMWQNSS